MEHCNEIFLVQSRPQKRVWYQDKETAKRKTIICKKTGNHGFTGRIWQPDAECYHKNRTWHRFVADYEVAIFAELLNTTPEYLLAFTPKENLQTDTQNDDIWKAGENIPPAFHMHSNKYFLYIISKWNIPCFSDLHKQTKNTF